jgi:hypothetical protein
MGLPYNSLPESVKKLVDAEMLRRHGTKGQSNEAVEKYKESLKKQ